METDFGKDVGFIIDAGAKIGLTSAYFANRFPNARILALEVDRQNFELLAANTRHYPNITPLLKGLWYRRSNLVIDNPEEYPWAFTVSEAGQEGSSVVEGVSVADLLRDFGWERWTCSRWILKGLSWKSCRTEPKSGSIVYGSWPLNFIFSGSVVGSYSVGSKIRASSR
jgi:FkbM family methyltransferase